MITRKALIELLRRSKSDENEELYIEQWGQSYHISDADIVGFSLVLELKPVEIENYEDYAT